MALRNLAKSEGRQIAQFTLGLLAASAEHGPKVWSKVETDPDWAPLLEKGLRPEGAVVAFRVAESPEGPDGLFYFESAPGSRGELGFDREALAVASTHVELLGSGLLDGRGSARRSVAELVAREPFARVLTRSERMAEVLLLCEKVADSPYTVLFTGETGKSGRCHRRKGAKGLSKRIWPKSGSGPVRLRTWKHDRRASRNLSQAT